MSTPPAAAAAAASTEGGGEKKKRSGASQYRRKRISHPLMDPDDGASSNNKVTTTTSTRSSMARSSIPKAQPQSIREEKKEDADTTSFSNVTKIESVKQTVKPKSKSTRQKTSSSSSPTDNFSSNDISSPFPTGKLYGIPISPQKIGFFIAMTIFFPILICESFLVVFLVFQQPNGNPAVAIDGVTAMGKEADSAIDSKTDIGGALDDAGGVVDGLDLGPNENMVVHDTNGGAAEVDVGDVNSDEENMVNEGSEDDVASNKMETDQVETLDSSTAEPIDTLPTVEETHKEETESNEAPSTASHAGTTPTQELNDIQKSLDNELMELQTMLKEEFDKLRNKGADTQHSNTTSESLCKGVWNRAKEVLSEVTQKGHDASIDTSGSSSSTIAVDISAKSTKAGENSNDDNTILQDLSIEVNTLWRSLALDSQRCMGGELLSYLSKDVDVVQLQMARDIFERLSHVDPYNLDVQAGLGTCLLLQGVFYSSNEASDSMDEESAQMSLLTLATFHLKVASSLCSGSRGSADHAADNVELPNLPPSAALKNHNQKKGDPTHLSAGTESNSSMPNAAYNAVILHNLALAYIALGDTNSSVPVLLRAAALRRESSVDTNARPYWNVRDDVLLATEEKALLMGAKTKRGRIAKKRRIPFLSDDFNFEELAMGI